ncbi:MAG: PP0621 family protein [Rubrivivax sp.]
MALKYLLVLLVVGIVLWLLLRGRPTGPSDAARRTRGRRGPATMVTCSHCGLHLPPAEAISDVEGRRYCSDAHRLAGPR